MAYRRDSLRYFRPSLVARVDDRYLAIDDIQPVAVLVSEVGLVLGHVAWTDLPAPRARDWPHRDVVTDGSTVWVRDLPGGPLVRIEALSATSADPDEVPARIAELHSRFARSFTTAHGATRWVCASALDGLRWTATVNFESVTSSASWLLGSGSITSVATSETTAAVCVRRADKRPWQFLPAHDLYVLGSDGSEHLAVRHDQIDITRLCWPAEPAGNIGEYLPYSLSQCQAAIRYGATDVQLTVHDVETRPIIEIAFTLDGARYMRFDEPVDELGRMWGGMRDLGISMEEDLAGGLITQSREGPTGVAI